MTFGHFISCSFLLRERPVVADLNPHFVIIIISTSPDLPGRIGVKMEYRPPTFLYLYPLLGWLQEIGRLHICIPITEAALLDYTNMDG